MLYVFKKNVNGKQTTIIKDVKCVRSKLHGQV